MAVHSDNITGALKAFVDAASCGDISQLSFANVLAPDYVHKPAYFAADTAGERGIVVLSAERSTITKTTVAEQFFASDLAAIVLRGEVEGRLFEVLLSAGTRGGDKIVQTKAFTRLFPVASLARERVRQQLSAVVDPAVWQTPAHLSDDGKVREAKRNFVYAANMRFRSPILMRSVDGLGPASQVLDHASSVYGVRNYTDEVIEKGPARLMFWEGLSGGELLEAANIMTFNPNKELEDIWVFGRPWTASKALYAAIEARLRGNLLTDDYFTL